MKFQDKTVCVAVFSIQRLLWSELRKLLLINTFFTVWREIPEFAP